VLTKEFVLAALFIALALPLADSLKAIIAMMWMLAFSSSTRDITADGISITSLNKKRQAAFEGAFGMSADSSPSPPSCG